MAKPIKLTQAIIEQMMAEFGKSLASVKLSDGKVTYTKALTYEKNEDDRVTILFEPVAYTKMLMLLHTFNDEVAWHGTVERSNDKLFIIKDIFVYPQEVTGTTVNTDQERYQTWMMELDDEIANDMRMQGHSHVRMSTRPSAVDTTFYDSILSQLGDDDWYIFMIYNKSLEHTVMVYDMRNNVMYEDDDIDVGIYCEGGDLEAFITDAKDDVVRKTPAYGGVGTTTNIYRGTQVQTAEPAAKTGKVTKIHEVKKNSRRGSGKNNTAPGRPYPGYYGGFGGYAPEETDYDELIFGAHDIEPDPAPTPETPGPENNWGYSGRYDWWNE